MLIVKNDYISYFITFSIKYWFQIVIFLPDQHSLPTTFVYRLLFLSFFFGSELFPISIFFQAKINIKGAKKGSW